MTFDDLFRQATGNVPFPYQREFAQRAELPDLLRAPTGSGKTATAILSWLWRRRYADPAIRKGTPRRLIFCLPMRTLVEQTRTVAKSWLSALDCHDIGVFSLMGGAIDDKWDTLPERDMIIVGTQDQLLSRALNRGYAMSRYRWPMHFALLNNDCLWILDEVQLMGVGLSTAAQLDALRQRWKTFGPTHSVWMSATLDEGLLRTVDQGNRPLSKVQLTSADHTHSTLAQRLTAHKPISLAATVIDQPKAPLWKALAAEITTAHQDGTLTLVILNRVDHARELFSKLPPGSRLLHSRYRPHERGKIQAEVLQPGFTGILVSTQTVEAGVDLDARVLFTAIAPWDSMVQRFGRCNRRGKFNDAQVYWIDQADKLAAPYELESLTESKSYLADLTDVGLESLKTVKRPFATPTLPVIRAKDVQDLFDTTPDLTGFDLDVGIYIRDTDSADVAVAWRDFENKPDPDMPALHRDELCRVPVGELRKLLKDQPGWRWDRLTKKWQKIDSRRPPVGDSVLVSSKTGGYDAKLGWTGNKKHKPDPVFIQKPIANDADDREPLSRIGHFVTLDQHAADVANTVTELQAALPLELPWKILIEAGRIHDWGKAHDAFQHMMLDGADEATQKGGPWAKSNHRRGKLGRPSFRHELASGLAALQTGADFLTAYLVVCHHGKVRTAIRARPTEKAPKDNQPFALGVHHHDDLPATTLAGQPAPALQLDLAPMALGPNSWTRRVLTLLDTHGPFRLAFLETIIRIADWRGSAMRDQELTCE